MTDRATLTVNGVAYRGWKTISVTRAIQQVAGTFDLAVSDRFPLQLEPWPIREGDECTVQCEGVTVITGKVDRRRLGFGPGMHSFGVSGRDRTGLLVDCSVDIGTWELAGQKVDAIVKKLATPFGVKVSLGAGVTLPAARDKFALNPGETAFAAIDRACRLAGVLPVSDGAGGIVLSQTGTARCVTALVQGQNLIGGDGDFDSQARFGVYKVRGSGAGNDDAFGETVAAVSGEAKDEGADPARVLVIRPEGNVTTAQARERAQWEAATRAARAGTATVKVQGWTQGDGSLWPINSLVRLDSSWVGISADMLISEVNYGLDDSGGTITTLKLMRPDAFKPKPVVPKATDTWSDESF